MYNAMKKMASKTSPATVISAIALFVSLGGTATATLMVTSNNIKNGTIRGKDIQKGQIASKQIKDGSIKSKDLAENAAGPSGQEGSAGAQGAQGLQGAPGDSSSSSVGAMSVEGQAGPEGPQGPQGPEGPEGPEGPQGPEGGPQGPEGPEGPEGPAGPSQLRYAAEIESDGSVESVYSDGEPPTITSSGGYYELKFDSDESYIPLVTLVDVPSFKAALIGAEADGDTVKVTIYKLYGVTGDPAAFNIQVLKAE